jgi:PBS lyase HEAT-like repeat-containing protein
VQRPTTQPPGPPGASAARDAGSAIAALSRVTRSFALYDAENAVVRQLLADYGAKMRAAIDARGALVLEVRGYELLVGGEVVYHDRDREKSLAFRLYRDGIRRLTLTAEVGWDELVRLVEIVAVRCTALRSTEEDLVTLLRKAELRGVHLEAVEGFVPAEEAPEPAAPAADEAAVRGGAAELPRDWDMPLQKLPAPGPLEHRAIDEVALAALAAAAAPDVDGVALSVAEELLDASHRAGWPVPNADLAAFLAELRDALLADGRLDALKRLVDVVRRVGGEELREETLRGLGDARALDLVLAATPPGETALPRELSALLPLVRVEAVLDRLAVEASEARRTLLCELVAARLPRAADAVVPRLGQLPAGVARALARAVVERAPERALDVARELMAHADEAYRLEGLAALDAAPRVPLHALCALLRDRSAAVRARAAEVLGQRGDESAAEPLRAALEDGASGPPLDEADALGRALAEVAPVAAERLFEGWIAPRARFLRGPTARARALQWAAVAGYGALPGPAAEAALRALAERAEGDLRRHLLATLARRRKALHARG